MMFLLVVLFNVILKHLLKTPHNLIEESCVGGILGRIQLF